MSPVSCGLQLPPKGLISINFSHAVTVQVSRSYTKMLTNGFSQTGDQLDADSSGKAHLPQICNPPLVHGIATMRHAQRPFSRVFATACGDGSVAVYDADPDAAKGKHNSGRDKRCLSPLFIRPAAHSSASNCV